jgi:O-acetyl-ADP-ribose deacetylase (regulator of RNase III)
MLEELRGNLLRADAEALVNAVNTEGVMGKGIALQFKRAFPDNFEAYATAARKGDIQPGKMFVHATARPTNPRFIINFPTKRQWRSRSRMEDIEAGLTSLVAEIQRLGVRSVAIPALGCGLGGLRWGDVRPRIEAALAELPDVKVLVFAPDRRAS